jgi:uncharacterized protein (DUF1015 family)
VTDPTILDQVSQEMAPKSNLIIADGHHRYETALNYREELRNSHPDAPPNAGFNYRLVTMVSMSNPGLTILPTHRLIFDFSALTGEEILTSAKEYFDIKEVNGRDFLENDLAAAGNQVGRIGFVHKGGTYVLSFKSPEIMAELAPDRVQVWRDLDVSILHKLLLEKIMGVDPKSIDNLENIKYLREPDLGYDEVDKSSEAFLFILNATRIDQVTACTEIGEKMPQKSTDFYPKIISGLAMLPVHVEEIL